MLPLKAATSCSSAYAHQLILWGVRTSVVNQMTGEGVSLTSRSLRRQQRHADFLLMVDSMQYPARTNTWRSRKGSGAHILWGFRFCKVCAPKTAAHEAERATASSHLPTLKPSPWPTSFKKYGALQKGVTLPSLLAQVPLAMTNAASSTGRRSCA